MSQPVRPEETYIYALSERVLGSLELMYFDSATTEEKIKSPSPEPVVTAPPPRTESPSIRDKDYYKSDLHRLNLKRELRGLPKLTEEIFEQLADELNIAESISGSEDESEDDEDDKEEKKTTLDTIFEKSIQKLEALKVEQDSDSVVSHLATRSPFILFKSELLPNTKCFGVYKSTFDIHEIEAPLEALKKWQTNQAGKKSALFMIGGGHFAGAIINHKPKSTKGNTVKPGDSLIEQSVDVVVSKSFHRYTTRRKQGGSQSASDNARGKANSAGSSLRRHNEAALQNEVRELLKSWKAHLDGCDSIFIRANGASNRNILVGYEGAVLKNDDVRIKSFPFTTKRATTSELKKAWVQLTYLAITDKPSVDEKKAKQKQAQEQLRLSTQKKEKEKVEESPEEKHTKEIVGYLKKARGPVLLTYMKKHKLPAEFTLQPSSEYYSTPTVLHYASAHGIKNLVPILMKMLKADPTIQNASGKTPYEIAANRATRQAFQVARHELGESAFDWEAAHVGPAISRDAIETMEKEEKQREEEEKKKLIKEELAKATPVVPSSPAPRLGGVNLDQVNLNSLTDEQRMRVMREQRARAAEARLKAMREAQNK